MLIWLCLVSFTWRPSLHFLYTPHWRLNLKSHRSCIILDIQFAAGSYQHSLFQMHKNGLDIKSSYNNYQIVDMIGCGKCSSRRPNEPYTIYPFLDHHSRNQPQLKLLAQFWKKPFGQILSVSKRNINWRNDKSPLLEDRSEKRNTMIYARCNNLYHSKTHFLLNIQLHTLQSLRTHHFHGA